MTIGIGIGRRPGGRGLLDLLEMLIFHGANIGSCGGHSYPRIGASPLIASDEQEQPGLNAKVCERLVGADAAG